MIFLTKTYLNQYIYSPITRYHKIHIHAKILTVYITMFLVLYLELHKYIVITKLILLIFIILGLYSRLKFLMSNIIRHNLFYLAHTYILNHFMNYNEIKKKNIIINTFMIINSIQIDVNNNRCDLKYYSITYYIPQYLLKIIYLYIFFSNVNIMFFMCTQSHNIVETLIYYLKKIPISVKITYNKIITHLYLGYQSLENIMRIWTHNATGKQLKSRLVTKNIEINGIIILMMYYINILVEENNNSVILWNRDLCYNNFRNLKYYY